MDVQKIAEKFCDFLPVHTPCNLHVASAFASGILVGLTEIWGQGMPTVKLKRQLSGLLLTVLTTCLAIFRSEAAEISVDTSRDIPFVKVEGRLDPDDALRFIDKTARLPGGIVFFNSPGGNLLSGIFIGKAIRAKRFVTAVESYSACESACAIAWLAGTIRYMPLDAKVGFHAAYDSTTGRETGSGNALLGAYFKEIGLSYEAILFLTEAPPTGMTYLTPELARKLKIAIEGWPKSKEEESPSRYLWGLNGSLFSIAIQENSVRIYYYEPRQGLVAEGVQRGTLYFDGTQSGRIYDGRSRLYSKRCGTIEYRVKGEVSEGGERIFLRGYAPVLDVKANCRTIATREVIAELGRFGPNEPSTTSGTGGEERTAEPPRTAPPRYAPPVDDMPFVPPWEVKPKGKRL